MADAVIRRAVFDTGPIVAAFLTDDDHHQECAAFLSGFTGHRLLPTTVLAEVCRMLERQADVESRFLRTVGRGVFTLAPIERADIEHMADLVDQYADSPRGGVDASMKAVADRLGVDTVATIDHRHFRAVRRLNGEVLSIVPRKSWIGVPEWFRTHHGDQIVGAAHHGADPLVAANLLLRARLIARTTCTPCSRSSPPHGPLGPVLFLPDAAARPRSRTRSRDRSPR